MPAADLLQKLPAELFPGGVAAVKDRFRELAKLWHPDVNKDPEATRVFEHIQRCRDYLLSGAAKSIDLHDRVAKKTIRFSYLSEHRVAGIKVLVGATTVNYLIGDKLKNEVPRVLRHHWEFSTKKMEDQMSHFLPEPHKVINANEGWLMSYRREPGDVLLSDLLDYHNRTETRIPPLAVMWMISGLLNLACYLEITSTAHAAFREEFIVVNPDKHEVKLVGPALFATNMGERPKIALPDTLRDYPILRTKDKTVDDSRLDLTLIRSLAMRLLGHRTTRQVRNDREIPEGVARWLESPPTETAVEDYVRWEDLRGKRAFHIYGLSARDVYVSLL